MGASNWSIQHSIQTTAKQPRQHIGRRNAFPLAKVHKDLTVCWIPLLFITLEDNCSIYLKIQAIKGNIQIKHIQICFIHLLECSWHLKGEKGSSRFGEERASL
ncbi:hypothetical protein ACJX0J_007488 [Zea mays]